ncbi:MAG: hypothetical protein C0506_03980 [Anaerolinea sp.]|nr:hypothetical protein [Anaerolinea sp.]
MQRIWSSRQFKEASSAEDEDVSKRKKVVPVETALAAFWSTAKSDWPACVAALQTVVTECTTYLDLWFRSKVRKTAVGKLKDQAAAEAKLFGDLIAANGLAYAAKMKALLKVIDDSVAFKNTGLAMGAAYDEADRIIRGMISSHDVLDQAALKQVMDAEIQRLRDIAADDSAPQIVRDVITENLAHIDEVHLQEGKPGARMAKVGETDRKYVVNHALVQAEGSTERLGSLMHEMTHVTTGETFDNAPLFLVFQKGKQVGPEGVLQIKTLAKARNKGLLDVVAAAEGDAKLTAPQKKMVKDKCEYANKPMLAQYLGTMKEKLGGVDSQEYKTLKSLSDDPEINPFTGTLIEYDSVINQVLMYLFDWQVKPPSPTWVLVEQLATEARQFRASAGG